MKKWQPPIPSGALYSKPARQLGPALPLLAYCYDLVQRDGWFEIVLKDVAGDMDEPYPNVKRYWHAVREGGFFAEVIDRGKLGWRVRFKEVWLDWRILQAREQAGPFKDASRTDEVSEVIPQDDEGQMKDTSRTNEGSEMILQAPAYKVLHDDQESKNGAAQKTHTSKPKPPRTDRAPPTNHQQLMAGYQEALGYKIPNPAKEATAAKKILDAGYTVEQAIDAYHALKGQPFWADKHLSLHKVFENIGALLVTPKEHARRDNASQRRSPAQPVTALPSDADALPADALAQRLAERLASRNGKTHVQRASEQS